MKTTSLVFAIVVAFLIAAFGIFYFVHPVLILTLKDIFWLVIFDAFSAFFLALYLRKENNKNSLILWTIVGAICLPISIIAAIIKYNRWKAKNP